jgi:hypothetical protein
MPGVVPSRRDEPDATAARPAEVEVATAVDLTVGEGSAAEEVAEQGGAVVEIGHDVSHVVEDGGRLGGRRRQVRCTLRLPVAIRGLGQLHDHAQRLLGVDEGLLPLLVAEVDADGAEPSRADRLQRGTDVADLEGQVVRPRTAGGQEPLEEVVALHRVGLQHLHLHAVRVGHLRRREARAVAAAEPPTGEITRVPGPGVRLALGGDGDVVEVDVCDHDP